MKRDFKRQSRLSSDALAEKTTSFIKKRVAQELGWTNWTSELFRNVFRILIQIPYYGFMSSEPVGTEDVKTLDFRALAEQAAKAPGERTVTLKRPEGFGQNAPRVDALSNAIGRAAGYLGSAIGALIGLIPSAIGWKHPTAMNADWVQDHFEDIRFERAVARGGLMGALLTGLALGLVIIGTLASGGSATLASWQVAAALLGGALLGASTEGYSAERVINERRHLDGLFADKVETLVNHPDFQFQHHDESWEAVQQVVTYYEEAMTEADGKFSGMHKLQGVDTDRMMRQAVNAHGLKRENARLSYSGSAYTPHRESEKRDDKRCRSNSVGGGRTRESQTAHVARMRLSQRRKSET